MRSISCYIIIVILALVPMHVFAAYMYWGGNFGDIELTNITSQGQVSEDSRDVTLSFDGDAEITADNSISSQLSCATDTLITEYKLSFDGDGDPLSGGTDTTYEDYSTFLSAPSAVIHADGDDDAKVTLHVRVRNNSDEVADSGTYNATQTLTVSWVGP